MNTPSLNILEGREVENYKKFSNFASVLSLFSPCPQDPMEKKRQGDEGYLVLKIHLVS
jgi:hypothetical protein